jgi:hypothetical protein
MHRRTQNHLWGFGPGKGGVLDTNPQSSQVRDAARLPPTIPSSFPVLGPVVTTMQQIRLPRTRLGFAACELLQMKTHEDISLV